MTEGPTSVTSTWTSEPRQTLKRGQIESLHLKRRAQLATTLPSSDGLSPRSTSGLIMRMSSKPLCP
jgi:hypothetical protein